MILTVQRCRGAAVRFAGASRWQEADAILARFQLQPYDARLLTQPLHGDKTFVEDRVGSSTNTDTRLDNRSIFRT